jgi:hypothetical protein
MGSIVHTRVPFTGSVLFSEWVLFMPRGTVHRIDTVARAVLCERGIGSCLALNFFWKSTVAFSFVFDNFVQSWTRLKRFISIFTDKLCN